MAKNKKSIERFTDGNSDNAPLIRPLTKSKFKMALECPTKLFYKNRPKEYADDKMEDPFLRNLARGGFQVGALAKLYFPGGVDVKTLDYAKSLEETNQLLKQDRCVIFEAAFRYENFFVRADIVRKEGDKLFLYEVKSASYDPQNDSFWQKRKTDRLDTDWKPYLYDVAFQHFVIRNALPGMHVVPHLLLADKTATASVDGLNQKFRLVKKDGRDSVESDPNLWQSDLGSKLLCTVDVSAEVSAIQDSKPNGDEPPDWPQEMSFSDWLFSLSQAYLEDKFETPKITSACKACEYRVNKENYPGLKSGFEQCWTQALNIEPSKFSYRTPIFDIWSLPAPKLLGGGVHFIDQLSESDLLPKNSKKEPAPGLTTGERKVLQWERTLKGDKSTYFDKDKFLEEVADYPKPFHFIDFETCTVAIPSNKGRRPYEQIAFQFSHHVLHEDGRIEHATQWIGAEAGRFPNFDFVRALKAALSRDNGTVFRFASHENTVLNQIRAQLLASEEKDKAELVAWIESIAAPTASAKGEWKPTRNFVDMRDLVLRYFWHPRMGGSNSIKDVLPAMLEASGFLQEKYRKPIYGAAGGIASLNYRDHSWIQMEDGLPRDPYRLLPPVFDQHDRNTLDRLYDDSDLGDGGAAMVAYAKLQFTTMSEGERKQVTGALLRYCELDTLAMAMIWDGWSNL
jgi:hypothetical protein